MRTSPREEESDDMKRILCPIDFDEHSTRALARAEELALRHGAELLLLHVVARPDPIVTPSTGPAIQARTARARLDELAAKVREGGLRCEAAILGGDPALQILQAARDGGADLIVMATHGRHGVSRVVLGSVTEAVLHATKCPLLTIPPRAGDAAVPFRRVLCAVDFAPSSLTTLESAQAMVQDADSVLTVVHVIDRAFAAGGPPMAARARVKDALWFLHDRGPVHSCVVRDTVRMGETAAEVLKLAAEEDAHLIVVGAHSRRPGMAAMIGSCADRIVRESACPVLAVPPPVWVPKGACPPKGVRVRSGPPRPVGLLA